MGGVSQGVYATMNFAFTKGDDPLRVKENYKRMAELLEVDSSKMVLSWQTHTTNIRKVTREDEGKGIVRERDYQDVDGLITNIPGITLVTFYADCVPLYFLDPVKRAIGLSHSGWRGTVAKMGEKTVQAMKREYGSRPEDMIACIGPSICGDCYQVGEEVAAAFMETFDWAEHKRILRPEGNGKYRLNLWEANRLVLRGAGIPENRIQVTDICTHCNPNYLFSHRTMGDKRGNLAAFLCLKEL
ncbi:MAG TPA: peptidoglycan editing factor PgeF [Candidatus Hungatella pullicola]|nr:peptidoglycan editing factor PgeF [Candidatus Hungatella pullicola]